MGLVQHHPDRTEAAFFLHAGGAGVEGETAAEDGVEPGLGEEPAQHGVHGLGHQAPAPIGLGQHEAELAAAQIGVFGEELLLVFFDAEGADDLAPVLEREGLLFGDELSEYPAGDLDTIMREPAGVFADALDRGVLEQVLKVALPPRAQDQPVGAEHDV